MKRNFTEIEIPFGAKDSELYQFTYTIPDGYSAEIKDGKVIIKKKESKDEKIRKKCIEFIRRVIPDGSNQSSESKEILDCIAYLEKQKEQKPNPYTGTGFDYNGHHWGMCARDGGVEIIVDGKIRDRVFFESGSIEWSYSVAKEMFIKALERAVELTKNGYELTDCDKHSWWEDFKAYSEIKSAEWSEEDKKMHEHIISDLREFRDCETDEELISDYEDEIAWLKSFRLQSKQESEPIEIKYAGKIYKVYGTKELPGGGVGYIIEDEPGHYDCIIHPDEVLGGGYGIKSNGSPYPTKEANFGQPSWKPSEEQVKPES